MRSTVDQGATQRRDFAMVGLGVKRENIWVVDSKGVLREDREDFRSGKADESKHRYCQRTDARTLADIVRDADVFLGCSAPGVMRRAGAVSRCTAPIASRALAGSRFT